MNEFYTEMKDKKINVQIYPNNTENISALISAKIAIRSKKLYNYFYEGNEQKFNKLYNKCMIYDEKYNIYTAKKSIKRKFKKMKKNIIYDLEFKNYPLTNNDINFFKSRYFIQSYGFIINKNNHYYVLLKVNKDVNVIMDSNQEYVYVINDKDFLDTVLDSNTLNNIIIFKFY
jgi:hypothetical protein